MKLVVVREVLNHFKILFSLLSDVIQYFTTLVDLFIVVLKNKLFLVFVQIRLIFDFEVLIYFDHIFSLKQKSIFFIKTKRNLIYDCLTEMLVINAEISADSFVENKQGLVELMISMDFQGPAVGAGGIVKVEINEGVIYLFFYLVFRGQFQSVLHTQIEEKEDFLVL